MSNIQDLFSIKDQVVVFTGGTGVLGSETAKFLGRSGAKVVIVARSEKGDALCNEIKKEGGDATALRADALNREQLEAAKDAVIKKFGRVDALLNFAGGNHPEATTNADRTFFDLPAEALDHTFKLNLSGTIFPTQAFAKPMTEAKQGIILNISSMSSMRPLTRVIGYSAAKAAINNLTQWLSVHMAQEYSPAIRVNAIAPGFFLSEQNRYLLTDKETGELTPRGKSIIGHTPQGRFGVPEDIFGAVAWLISPASKFVTGIVVPIDGGFDAFSGV